MKLDSHQHFWQYNESDYGWMSDQHAIIKKDFLPEHLQTLLATTKLDGCIAVQARQVLAETDFLLQLAKDNSFIKGVVGWIPFCDAQVEGYLEQYVGRENWLDFVMLFMMNPTNNLYFALTLIKVFRHLANIPCVMTC